MKHSAYFTLIILMPILLVTGSSCSRKKAGSGVDQDLAHPQLSFEQVMPGLQRASFSRTNSPLTYHVVKADLRDGSIQVAALVPKFRSPTSNGKSTIAEMLPEADTDMRQGIAAISGDYFANGMAGPWGVHVVDHKLLYSPQGRVALMVDPAGKPFFDHPHMSLQVQVEGKAEWTSILDMNRPGTGMQTGLHLYAYTRQVDTAPAKGGAVRIDADFPIVGGIVSGKIDQVWSTEETIPLPVKGLVLACYNNGEAASTFSSDFPLGAIVSIRTSFDRPATEAMGGGPQIVRDGKVSLELAQDGIGAVEASYLKRLHPRSVIGITRDAKEIMFVMVQGRSDTSKGIGVEDLATLMVGLGSDEAIMLDGGDSAALYVGTNYLAHGRGGPRGMVNGVGLYKTKGKP
jgi:hypothetical protein